ncbi:hypothetical protein ATG_18730 [Desulfurococcaceae archaeon AG1]|nr:hypothetical protein ATG_18730 [Desulfurococcaceae archaeon AG1]
MDIATKDGIAIKNVALTPEDWVDYYEYVNLLFYESVRGLLKGLYSTAQDSYRRARGKFDGKGFQDKTYYALGYYEAYKLGLALYTAKALSIASDVELFTLTINSISPLATLYDSNMAGVGDLNIETASIIAIALYSDLPYRLQPSIAIGGAGAGVTGIAIGYIISALIAIGIVWGVIRWLRRL